MLCRVTALSLLLVLPWNLTAVAASAAPTATAASSFRCPILYYHEVTGQRGLDAQISSFVRAGYQIVSMATLMDALEGAIEPPRGCLVLTFDDGLRSQHRNALPVL